MSHDAAPPPAYLRACDTGIEITLRIVPGASRDRIVGPHGDALKIQVAATPERGKANASVIRLLAERLSVAQKQIAVIRGAGSPRKTLRVLGMTVQGAISRLVQT